METQREAIDVEPIKRESVDFDMKVPTKLEKPEAPAEEVEITQYEKPAKDVTKDEVDAVVEIGVPRVKVGGSGAGPKKGYDLLNKQMKPFVLSVSSFHSHSRRIVAC